ncbi:hypothetical protein BACCIP111895_03130 [Neobacillus rhizosphaerae]|uniref:Exosporium protein C n=1 Tax=Neobacillus rhizosphaerae TaxID=2880965 RepID=A0ABN8KQG4_9BACI|nr:hypothetical protein BACCIP111895_03130 [Neobacillus rhizosphaerae]
MVRIIDYQATEPVRKVNQIRPRNIPHSPKKVVLATIRITIPRNNANNNHVELIATVGVRGVTGTSQLLFKIFRDGKEIFSSQDGVESDPTSEVNYTETFQAIDMNVGQGAHTYQVTAENITNGTEAAVVGPISFSGLAIAPSDKDHDSDQDQSTSRDRITSRDRDRNRDMERNTSRDRDRDRDMERNTSRDRDRDRERNTNRDRDRDMERNTSRDRDRDRDMDRNTNRDRDRDRERNTRRSMNRDQDRERNMRSGFDNIFRMF